MRCGVWRAATDALGILTRSLVITGMMATGTISAGPALTAAATMAAALVLAGRGHLSGRSGIAADQPIAQGRLIDLTACVAALATSDACHRLTQSAFGTNRRLEDGQSMSALPGTSDINLFCYCQSIVYFDPEIPDRAFDLGVTEHELDSPKIAGPPVDQSSLRAS